jgi:hypothetical protein
LRLAHWAQVAGKQQAAVEMLAQKQAEAESLAAELELKDARYTAEGFNFDRHVRDKEEELLAAREQAPMVSAAPRIRVKVPPAPPRRPDRSSCRCLPYPPI